MTSESPTHSRQRLADLMEIIDTAQNPELEILKHLIARAGERDPKLGDVIRYCAIPRLFDAGIIGVLRDAPDEEETNRRLLEKLLSFNFVRTRPDGGYTYHDSTRDILLDEWRAADKRDEFDRLNQQLITFYKGQYEKVERLEGDLFSVARVMQRTNAARYLQLTSIFETLIVAPLLEALYHKSLLSAETCYRYFEGLFQEQEKAGRLMARESLLNATRDYLERLPPDSNQAPWLKWLKYWKARLKLSVRTDKRAEEILLEVLPETGDDLVLRLWVLSDLGLACSNQSKYKEAQDFYQQAIDLAKETGQDPYNLPVWYSRLAQLHWLLAEMEEAEEKYREAIRCSQGSDTQAPNIDVEVTARINLSGVLYARGQWESALNEGIEAFHIARTKLTSDRSIYRSVVQQLMTLLARRDPSLLDTIFQEADSSFADVSDPLVALGFRLQYTSLVWQSGQLRRGDEQLAMLLGRARKQGDALFYCEVLLEHARLRDEQGQLETAVEVYDELLKQAAGHENCAFYEAAAISNRGMLRTKLALWEQAEADLQDAVRKWRDMDHDKLEAFLHVALAAALRRQGRLQQAQELLNRAFDVLGGTHSSYLNDLYLEQGEVYQAQGRVEEARRAYRQALDGFLRLDQFKNAALSLGHLTTLASDRGDWVEAARCSAEANELWRRLAEIDAYCSSAAQLRADETNANGVQAFFRTDSERLEKIREARASFRAAGKAVPDNFWYRLNLAYACAELGEWQEAAEAIGDMLKSSHKWLRTRMLYERLADYLAKQGEKIFGAGQYEEAARFYAESRSQLEGKVTFERLAEVIMRRGDSFLRLAAADAGRTIDAQTAYEEGMSRAEKVLSGSEADDGEVRSALVFQATLHARLGFLRAVEGNLPKALEHFRASVGLRTRAKQTNVAEDIVGAVSEFSDVVSSVKQFRIAGEALRALADDRSIDVTERRRLLKALFDFSESRYQVTRRGSGDAAGITSGRDFLPIPILLEADSELFPLGEATPGVIRMIQVDIPAMRQERLYKSMGVVVPGVRIRVSDELNGGSYVLALNEIKFEAGVVVAGAKFCPDAARCREMGIEGLAAPNPEDRRDGMWLEESACERAEEDGLTLIDPYQYMILHLGVLLRRHLMKFVGIQETREMLTHFSEQEEDRRTLVEKAVPDDEALVRLTRVLQNLLREDVPVRNLFNILTTFAEVNPTSPELIDVTERIRAALRSDLPVNNGARRLIGLSQDFEAAMERWVQRHDDKSFLAMPEMEAIPLMEALRRGIDDRAPDEMALIVDAHGLRPFVQRFVSIFYPSLIVSSLSELDDATAPPDERIELTVAEADDTVINGEA